MQLLDFVDWLDMHSFLTNYNVWNALNVDINASNIWFPLPPCARLIRFQNSLSNVFKGASRAQFCCWNQTILLIVSLQRQGHPTQLQSCLITVRSTFL